jgi:hypothetical protein
MKEMNFLSKQFQASITRFPVLAVLPLTALILFVGLACAMSLGGSEPPADRTPAAPPAQQQDWRTAISNAKPGDKVDITLTEADLTSLVSSQLQRNNSDVTINDPRIVLRDGKMEIYGKAVTNTISGNFKAVINLTASQGKVHAEVISADFGSFPVPSSLRERMNESLDQALSQAAGNANGQFKVNQVTISDGYMTISGTVNS